MFRFLLSGYEEIGYSIKLICRIPKRLEHLPDDIIFLDVSLMSSSLRKSRRFRAFYPNESTVRFVRVVNLRRLKRL